MLTNTKSPTTHAIYRAQLKETISASQKQIRENINATGSHIIHRTQAINAKRPKSVKHKISVLMIFGLLAFVFRLKSRREMNRELTGAAIHRHLQKIFPI